MGISHAMREVGEVNQQRRENNVSADANADARLKPNCQIGSQGMVRCLSVSVCMSLLLVYLSNQYRSQRQNVR